MKQKFTHAYSNIKRSDDKNLFGNETGKLS